MEEVSMKAIVWAAFFALVVLINPAHAAKVYWGDQEEVHKIQATAMKDTDGKSLFLAYRTKSTYFGGGVNISDLGYALGVEGERSAYYPLTQEKIVALQQAGALPNPLPKYSISWFDYMVGNSWWIAIFGTAVLIVMSMQLEKWRAAKEPKRPTDTNFPNPEPNQIKPVAAVLSLSEAGFAIPAMLHAFVLFMIQLMFFLALIGIVIPEYYKQGVSWVLLVTGSLLVVYAFHLVLGEMGKLIAVKCSHCNARAYFRGFTWWPFTHRYMCESCGVERHIEMRT
jgi:hypothetical protein